MKSEKEHPLISVIIPTFNRAELLRLALESLTRQILPQNQFEVIVVDDGSTDCTHEVCRTFQSLLPLKYVYQENSGISAAKNIGVFSSSGLILFFFDDDDVADENLLGEHLKSHQKNPDENIAVLGYTTWHSSLKMTQVMYYITNIGHFLFSYTHLKNGQVLDFTYFWGGRSSCKRSLLVKHGVFNPEFRFGSEDIELGFRLAKNGLRVIYNPKAISYMMRPITYDEFCRRCEKQGKSQYFFSRFHSDAIIQNYCMVYKAEEKWQYIEKGIEKKVARVHEIESLLASRRLTKQKSEEILPELGNLYWWTFNAFKIKGIVDAEHDMSLKDKVEIAGNTVASAVDGGDIHYFNSKWSLLPVPAPHKGNILVIDPFLPMFDRASGSLRLFQILKSLLKLGYHITFIARDGSYAEQYVPILQRLGIEVLAGDPSALDAWGINCIAPYLDLENTLKKRFFEAVVLDFWNLAEYYLPLVRQFSPSSTIIVDTVDIHFIREIREAEIQKNDQLMQKALRNKNKELAIYNQADRLWVVTEDDKKAIKPLVGSTPIDIVPNVHDKITVSKKYEETSDILFVGNFNHLPNRDAIIFFCKEVMPRILAELPEVNFYVVGNNPPDEIKALATEHIVITGYVKDLIPYLKKARISVSPLRYGAGMKGKVGEALSWGLPVVTTTIGAEGMSLVHEQDVLIADAPEAFAQETIRLYRDRELWNRLSVSGKKKVEREWSPEAVQNRIKSIFMKIENPQKEELTSIIILAFNEMEYTKKCIESIFNYTTKPYELIIVDNGSTDGTIRYLDDVVAGKIKIGGHQLTLGQNGEVLISDKSELSKAPKKRKNKRNDEKIKKEPLQCRRMTVIRNGKNLGFAEGNNRGMAASKGDYVLLMNNDVVVTPGWLERMIAVAELDARIGIVGPMSNQVLEPQRIEKVAYDTATLMGLNRFSEVLFTKFSGRARPFWRVVGFCMLIKREVIEKIGGLDSRYGLGNFEDDDFSLRARLAGFESWIAEDCFIHHFGSRTFTGAGIDYRESLIRNWEIFKNKWGLPQDLAFGAKYDAKPIVQQPFVRGLHYCPLRSEEYTVSWGEELCRAGDMEGAKACFSRILEENPKNVEALNNLGFIAYQEGKIDQAMACFEWGLKIKPDHPDLLDNLGQLLVMQEDYSTAMPYFRKALNAQPDNVNLLNGYANCLIQTGELLDAEELYIRSYRLDKTQNHVREILGGLEQMKATMAGKRLSL